MLIYQGFQDTQTSATLLAYLHVKFAQRCLGRFSPNPDFFFYLAPKKVLNVGPLWLNTGRCIKNYSYGNLAYGSFILFASNLKSLGSLLGKLTGRIVLRKFK